MKRPDVCACSHGDDQHHPAGRCTAELPPFEEEELPAWRCPCRGFTGSRITALLVRSIRSAALSDPVVRSA